jgi:hypothetical protein
LPNDNVLSNKTERKTVASKMLDKCTACCFIMGYKQILDEQCRGQVKTP